MKRIFCFIVSILLSVVTFVGCETTPRDMMIGTFKVSKIESDQEMDEETREVWDEQMQSLKETSVLELHKDNTLVSTENGITQIGTWELLGEDQQLKFLLEGFSQRLLVIKEIARDHFVIIEHDEISNTTTTITYTKL